MVWHFSSHDTHQKHSIYLPFLGEISKTPNKLYDEYFIDIPKFDKVQKSEPEEIKDKSSGGSTNK